MRRRRPVLAVVALALLVGGCGASAAEWVWPTPYPLPSGARAVPLVTRQPIEPPADAEIADACPAMEVPAFVIEHDAGSASPVRYRFATGYEPVVWGVGFTARLNPRLEIIAPGGAVIAREGEPVQGMSGGHFEDGLYVCVHGYAPTRAR